MLENRMVLDDYYSSSDNEYEEYLEFLLEKDDEEWEDYYDYI